MKCNKIQKLLSSYLDKELKKEQTDAIEEHLSACRECESVLADLKMTVDMVSSLKDSDTPVDLMEGIYHKIAEKDQIKRARISPWVRISMEGLVAALAGLVVVYVSQLYVNKDPHVPYYRVDEAPVSEKVAPSVAQEKKKDSLKVSKESVAKLETADKISGSYEKTRAQAPVPSRVLEEDFAVSMTEGKASENEAIKAQHEFFMNVMNINESLAKINTLTGNLDGHVIDVLGKNVLLQVPAYNYHHFISDLEEIGSFSTFNPMKTKAPSSISNALQSAPTCPLSKDEITPVIIRIQFMNSFNDNGQ